MKVQYYVCDLPPDCTDEQLSNLLQPHGAVTAIEWSSPREGSDLRRAVATLETDVAPRRIIDRLNRQCVGAQPVVVTLAVPAKKFGTISNANRRRSQKIARMLAETESGPIGSLAKIIHICGIRFTLRMVKQAFAIEAAGGMMLPDGSRKRTIGGVFFYQARSYLSPAMHAYLFTFHKNNKTKKKAAAPAPQAEAQPDTPKPGSPAGPEPPVVAAAPSPDEALIAARGQLAALREQRRDAQAKLDAVRKGQAKTTGVFSLMKQVVDTQKAIDTLLAEHPALKT